MRAPLLERLWTQLDCANTLGSLGRCQAIIQHVPVADQQGQEHTFTAWIQQVRQEQADRELEIHEVRL